VGGALYLVAVYAFRPDAGLIRVANSFEPVGSISVRLMPYVTCVFYEKCRVLVGSSWRQERARFGLIPSHFGGSATVPLTFSVGLIGKSSPTYSQVSSGV
jgi:hypothetical protein